MFQQTTRFGYSNRKTRKGKGVTVFNPVGEKIEHIVIDARCWVRSIRGRWGV
ncbi:MAG: hypothetical protein ACYS19_08460 [Planctomycetota bacterium]|jgi:hypothetical protein